MAPAAEVDNKRKKPAQHSIDTNKAVTENGFAIPSTMQSQSVRPGLVTQQSYSVPSTPHVGASELGGSFRTPSPIYRPGHAYISQAAKSATDTTYRPYNARTLVAGCKYESGMINFKRRMPYSLGSDKLESSPTKVQKGLEPELDKKLTGDMRELFDRLQPLKDSEEARAIFIKKLEKLLNDRWPGNEIRVHVFGSSGNSLFTNDSDVDICITTPTDALRRTCLLAKALGEAGMQNIECRSNAKVPIVKIWDPELKLACDMNVNNTAALNNTRMMKMYVKMDPRVRPLAMIIKFWTRQRMLNDAALGGTLSSYTWLCMIINFLQCRHPKILPSLQKEPFYKADSGNESGFGDASEYTENFGAKNHESLAQLLFAFFRRYAHEIDYERNVISIREGGLTPKSEKKWHPSQITRLCVEEPFNTDRNLGNTADDTSFRGVHLELRRAFDLISQGKLEECFEQYVYPTQAELLSSNSSVFARPAAQPRPVLTRSQSQSGSSRTLRVDLPKKSSQPVAKQRTTSSNRRASSAMPPTKVLPHGMDSSASGSKLHASLALQYQNLQKQEQQLRARMQNQGPAPGQMYYWDANGNQYWMNYYAQMAIDPHRRSSNASHASSHVPLQQFTPITTIPGISGYLPHGFLNQTSSHHVTSNPPSPTMSSVQLGFRNSARRAAEQNLHAARSQSQPPAQNIELPEPGSMPVEQRGFEPGPSMKRIPGTLVGHSQSPIEQRSELNDERSPESVVEQSTDWQGYSFGQRTLQDIQNAYLRDDALRLQYEGLYGMDSAHYDSPIAHSEIDSDLHSQADSITDLSMSRDASRRETIEHVAAGILAHQYDNQKTVKSVSSSAPIIPKPRPRASSLAPSHGINFFPNDELENSPVRTFAFPDFDHVKSMVQHSDGPLVIDGSEASVYETPPEHFAELAVASSAYSSDDIMTPSSSAATPTQEVSELAGFDGPSERSIPAKPLPNGIQFGQFPPRAPFRPFQQMKAEDFKTGSVAPGVNRGSYKDILSGLGIQMTNGSFKDAASTNGVHKQSSTVAGLNLASTLKPGSVLSPVREVRTPSPTTTRASGFLARSQPITNGPKPALNGINGVNGRKERISSPLAPGASSYAKAHQRPRSVESEERQPSQQSVNILASPSKLSASQINAASTTSSNTSAPQKAKSMAKKEVDASVQATQQPTQAVKARSTAQATSQQSSWQQSSGPKKKKKNNKKSASVDSIALPVNASERKGG